MELELLPEYKCHKKVRAAKIVAIEHGDDYVCFHFDVGSTHPKRIIGTDLLQNKPTPEVGWYLVQYDNGYFSFSPAKEFEEGYTPIAETTFGQRLVAERDELVSKLDKLGIFLAGSIFATLSEEAKDLLTMQNIHMQSYCRVLQRRIAAL